MSARLFLLPLSAALLLNACSVRDPRAPEAATRHAGYATPMNTVGMLDEWIQDAVAVEQTGSRRSPTNTLVAWAELRNRSDDKYSVRVRTRFYDDAKRPLESTRWTRVFLTGRGLQSYEATSTSLNAAFYFIEVREAS